MCPPDHFAINYEINPWMSILRGTVKELAEEQWHTLYQTIIQCGAQIELVSPVAGMPDLVFTANSAMRVANQVYLSHFKHRERQSEYFEFKKWFTQAGYQIIADPPEFVDQHGSYIGPQFEGAGDALFVCDTLFAGYGFRTDKEIYPHLQKMFNIRQSVLCELADPYFYHLDTCFCPLNKTQALWFPGAFTPESQLRMRQHAELFAVPLDEGQHFACNAVIIQDNAIIPADCPVTEIILTKLGFKVYCCPMTEFIKSGGACKCLTFAL